MNTLGPKFFQKTTKQVAQNLLGLTLINETSEGRTSGMIVETEAYLSQDDPASHAHKGRSKRNSAMFGPAGHGYIYFIYGMYHCFNVVTAPVGQGEAVLIRALEPLDGIDLMARRRNQKAHSDNIKNLCNGPAKLVLALGITPQQNGVSLFEGPLRLEPGSATRALEIVATQRIGISLAKELPLRFYIKGNEFISKK